MTVRQLIEILSGFDPETTVVVAYPAFIAHASRVDTEVIHVEELARYDGIHPLISANGAHLLED
jgi:hypothetical protein